MQATMTDIYSEEKRSQIMSRVRAKDTKPEKSVRSILHRAGYRFRLHREDLPGKPDIVLPRYHTVIFVNGCFWHQHPGCRKATIPDNNRDFWKKKLNLTVKRDAQNKLDLKRLGWNVLIVWECDLLNSLDETMDHVIKQLEQTEQKLSERGLSDSI